jgi:hypothetical protein
MEPGGILMTFKKLCIGMGAVALAGAVLSLIAPKAVQAAAYTLVVVANTSAHPVLTADLNKSAAQNVELACSAISGSPTCALVAPNGSLDFATSWTVPEGMNFIITDVEILTDAASGSFQTHFSLQWTPPGGALRQENWYAPANGLNTQFTFPNGVVVLPGSTINPVLPSYCFDGIVRGYLTAN